VVPTVTAAALAALATQKIPVCRLTHGSALPFALRYEPPDTLGTDRIANALYGSLRYPDEPLILISVGTAITVDYMADRVFLGGAILPGVAVQLESLHRAGAALPQAKEGASHEIPELPATTTIEAMTAGVGYGIAGALDAIVARYCRRSAEASPKILATGGGWSSVSSLVTFAPLTVPEMTLVGTACCSLL
jgi:type III pantothenate kinase